MGIKKKLIKRDFGAFANNEIAVFGSNDAVIAIFLQKIKETLQKKYIIDFFINSDISRIKDIFFLSQLDFLLLNGNYFNANQQILILDDSDDFLLSQNLISLTNVQFVVNLQDNASFSDRLINEYPSIINLISYNFRDIDSICNHIENLILEKIAPLFGLVLIGGKSSRMGSDKSLLSYHGKPHRDFLVDLLSGFITSNNIFYSVRDSNKETPSPFITDKFTDLGPFGGICSAFMLNPNVAWLVIATDLPFVNSDLLNLLISNRNSSKIATTFIGNNNDFPEPLITIWEPKAYPILLLSLSRGELSLSKILNNNAIEVIEVNNSLLKNVNTKDDFDAIIDDFTD